MMENLSEIFAEINSCKYLFLRDLTEPEENSLRLLIEEASASGEPQPIKIAGTDLGNGVPISSTDDSRFFEITWHNYIAYFVRNESYTVIDKYEKVEWGSLAREYSKSRFLDYVSLATIAQADYPGPFKHIEIICEMHVIDIASTEIPRIQRLRPPRIGRE
jgi:hypothetical protein